MKDVQHKVNIYDIKNIDQNSCSFRLPESFIEIVKAETVYISDSKNKAKDVIEELGKLYDMKEVIIQALEKQVPKKPVIKEWSPARCPTCGAELSEDMGDGYYKHWYSKKVCDCGQKLDWS